MSLQPFELEGKYTSKGDIIGHGAFSMVCKGWDRIGGLVAIKILNRDWEIKANKNEMLKKQLEAEIKIMKDTNHKNIVRLFDVSQHPVTTSLCLVMEYCEGGDLEKYILANGGQLTEQKAKPLFRQLAEGIKHLCLSKIIHRDLKPENLLLTMDPISKEYIVKIADFGLARLLDGPYQMAQTQCGTRFYMAPEIQKGSLYTYKADLWSVGVIIYRTLTGQRLFTTLPTPRQLEDPTFRLYNPTSREAQGLSPECQHLLVGLLQDNPERRISWEEFYYHSFLKMETQPFWEQYIYNSAEETQFKVPKQTPKHLSSALASKVMGRGSDIPVLPLSTVGGTMNSLPTSARLQNSYTREIAEKRRITNAIKDLADTHRQLGKLKEAFVLYVELMVEIKVAMGGAVGGDLGPNDVFGLSMDVLPLACKALREQFQEILGKAMEIRAQLKDTDRVKNPLHIILENVFQKGRSGASLETQQNWGAAAEIYIQGLLCLNFLENYLRRRGSSTEQAYIIKYVNHFKYRLAFVTKKIQQPQ